VLNRRRYGFWVLSCLSFAAITVSRFLPSLLKAGFSKDVTGPISNVAAKARPVAVGDKYCGLTS
jgi:hypothetical protein